MANKKQDNIPHSVRSTAPADCVTEVRIGNPVLVVSGFFKKNTTATAADKMARIVEVEAVTEHTPPYPA
ncbi:MAG: transposon-encoded TnpW family protein [Roseburia sp.]